MSKKNSELFLVLKEPWFSKIKRGQKKEEYREIKSSYYDKFYDKREIKKLLKNFGHKKITSKSIHDFIECELMKPKFDKFFFKFDTLHFVLGYTDRNDPKKHILLKNPKIEIRTGRPEWGAWPNLKYFVITWDK